MNNDFKQHINRLRFSGLRPTRQRLLISKVLFDRSDTFHFTIENLKKIIKNNSKGKISIATLYNTIHAFEKNGYLKKLSLKANKTFYDTNVSNHHHFYDNDTGSLVDIKNDDILLSKIPKAPHGKKVKQIEITVSLETSNQNQKKIIKSTR
jgi:Fur family iron response transcriptional regulator